MTPPPETTTVLVLDYSTPKHQRKITIKAHCPSCGRPRGVPDGVVDHLLHSCGSLQLASQLLAEAAHLSS